jgi:two-component system osmolarity sensor histidine kinase EnvZ
MRGLAFRISLVVIATVVLLVIVAGGLRLVNTRESVLGVTMPRPLRVAAMADLVENTPEDNLPRVLRALNSDELSVSVTRDPPRSGEEMTSADMPLAMRAYRLALAGRSLDVMMNLEPNDAAPRVRLLRSRLTAPRPIRFVIGLRDGRSLVLETHSALQSQLTGLRISLLALLVAVVIGAISLWLLRKQIKPIEQLAAAVERFGTSMEVSPLPEKGAREVNQLTAAFNRLQSQISALIAGRTRMMAAISHDLGTYLTRLRLRAEYIPDQEQRDRAIQDVEDMHALMTDTLVMAKLDHDVEPSTTVNLVAMVKDVASRFQNAGSKVTFRSDVEDAPVQVRPAIFGRVFENLISNALKYGGEAEVAVSRKGDKAEILVEDRGPGIPPEDIEMVLEPFYRRDASRNQNERGFGLGLAIVADIVKRHAGTLSLEARPGGGLTARVTLNLAVPAKA